MPAQITALPTPPSTNDPTNFNTRADAFLGQMPTFVTEANALSTEVYGLAVQVTADKGAAATSEANAAASASSALNAPGTNGTSTTSLTIGLGTKVFVTQSGKAWSKGQGVVGAVTANPLNQMVGIITDYTGTNLTVEVSSVGGSGTFAAWTISMAAGAPLPMSSQAQAEAGVDQTTVMNPFRVAQAIAKQSSLVVDAKVTVATTLTNNSKYLQNSDMAVRGAGFTLPAANTYGTGGLKFAFANLGPYDLPIRDNTGALKAFVRPGNTATCFLIDITTVAGTWTFDGAAIYGETALYNGNGSGHSGGLDYFKAIQVDTDRDLLITQQNTLTKAVIYNKATGVWGAFVTVNGLSYNGMDAVLVSSTSALIVGQSLGGSTAQAVVLTISGNSVSAGSGQTYVMPSNNCRLINLKALSGSFIAFINDNTNSILYAVPLTVSGSLPTWAGAGTAANVMSTGSNVLFYDFGIAILGSSLVVMSVVNAANGFQARAMMVSGTTINQGTLYTAASVSNTTSFRYEVLSTGRIFVVNGNGGNAQARLLTVTVTAISAALATTGGPFSPGYANITCAPISTNKVVVFTMSGSVATTDIYTDTGSGLSKGTPLTINVVAPSCVTEHVSGNTAYLHAMSSTLSYTAKVDCSGASPNLVDQFLVKNVASGGQGAYIFTGGGDNGPAGTLNDTTVRSVAPLRGTNSYFSLTRGDDSYDAIIFGAFQPRRLVQDHPPGDLPNFFGKSVNEVYSINFYGANTVIRKYETA